MFASRQLAVPLATVLKGPDRYLALIGKGHQHPAPKRAWRAARSASAFPPTASSCPR
jgi:hypothetical protein